MKYQQQSSWQQLLPQQHMKGDTKVKTYSPERQAAAQLQLEKERQAMQEQAAAAERARVAAEEQATRDRFYPALDNAQYDAFARTVHSLAPKGFTGDPDQAAILQSVLAEKRAAVPFGSYDVPNYYAGTESATANALTEAGRQKYNKALTPTMSGFSNTFGDTSDDQIINDILTGQYDQAKSTLKAAQDRGQINPNDFAKGLGLLDEQRAAGNAKLQSLGSSIRGRYVDDLTNFGNQQKSILDQWSFGDADPTQSIMDAITGKASSYQQNLKGDLLSAIGGESYFDPNTVLQQLGTLSGPQNNQPANSPLLAALGAEEVKKKQTRGIGNEGVF